VLETLLVCFLFITFEPVKNFIRRIAGAKALGERYVVQTLLRTVSEKIVGTTQLSDLLHVVREAIQSALRVKEVALFVVGNNYENKKDYTILQQHGNVKPFNLKKSIKGLIHNNGIFEPRKIYTFHLNSMDVSYQLYVGIFLENTLTGFLAIGKKTNNDNFTFEEKELLLTLANQVSLAIENMESMKRRIELESKILEAEKLSSLGMLSTSIAHEVKNPLSSIKSIVQSMIDERSRLTETSEELQDLSMINEEINRLSGVVDQLLRFAKTERSDDQQFDLRKMVDTILAILRHEMRRHNISVFTDMPEQPVWSRYSQGHLKEIIFNLIINAIQSMSENGGRLYIQVSILDRPMDFLEETEHELIDGVYYNDEPDSEGYFNRFKPWIHEPVVATKLDQLDRSESSYTILNGKQTLRMVIRDTGPGISRRLVHDIFKPFYTTKISGTGMGLVIVKNKIELLGGKLFIKTRENEGSAFEMYIPI
jgi:signal transduction histidine kinase